MTKNKKKYLGDTKTGFYIRTFWYIFFLAIVILQLYGIFTKVNPIDVFSLLYPMFFSGAVFFVMGAWKHRENQSGSVKG